MTDQAQQPIDSNILRLLIREAVEREVANVVAPLRTAQQVQDGKITQFNKDVTQALLQLGDLDELVRGNPKQNLIGLAEQIKAQNTLINDVKTKLDKAEQTREALINQWRGAKYALGVLAFITGLPYLETIGKLLHIIGQ